MPAVLKNRIRDDSHQTNAPAAVNEFDPIFCKKSADIFRRFGINFAGTFARAAENTEAFHFFTSGGFSPRSANHCRRKTRSPASFSRYVTTFIRQSKRGEAKGIGTPSISRITTSFAASA